MFTKRRGSVRCSAVVLSAAVAGLVAVVAALGGEPGGSQDAGAPKLRRWRDSSGQYEIEASLERVLADGVQLRRKDGKLVTVPLARLSEDDRTYLQGLRQPNPFEVASETQAASKLGSALVVVTVKVGERESSVPGIVFCRQGTKSYVTLDSTRLVSQVAGGAAGWRSARPESVRILVVDGAGAPRQVAGEFVAGYAQRSIWIVAGPSAELPAPVAIPDPAPLREPFRAQLVGFQIDWTVNPPTFARTQAEATVTQVSLDPRGQIAGLQIEGDRVLDVQYGFVASEAGTVLGFFTQPATLRGEKPGPLHAWPIQSLARHRQPEIATAGFAPLRGDRETIEYQFVMYITDPFGLIRAPRLRIRRQPANPLPPLFPEIGAGKEPEPLADAVELKLIQGEPAEVVSAGLRGLQRPASAVTWVATWSDPNPGDVRHVSYRFQVVYQDATGRDLYQPPSEYMYRTRAQFFGSSPPGGKLPASPAAVIPGLDGRPLDMPRPAPHKAGGWLLTDDSSRVKEEATAISPRETPQPRAEERPLGGTAFTDGGLRGVPLDLIAQAPGTYDRRRAPMCFAPTGDWLYLVDGNNTLRKIRTRDLTEVAALPLDAPCEDMAFSQAGLIVPLRNARRVWVVDAESLRVRREVPLDGVSLVAASPANSIGFALALVANPDMVTVVASSRLAMIDFATGRRLHELCNQYRSQSGIQFLAVDNQPVLDAPLRNLELTQDGKHLFMASRSITRFRVDGQDLIFEERGPVLENGHTTHFVLSGDGTKTALPTGGGNGDGNFVIAIYDAKKLDRQLLSLSNGANPSALGFDPQSGQMYSPNNQHMQVFGTRGEKLSEAPLKDRDVRRIIVHPQGGRFVAWGATKVTWYEVRP